jgi:glutamate synthase domain-containing protein 3
MAQLTRSKSEHPSYALGWHSQPLKGTSIQAFFSIEDEAENFTYPGTHDVDFNKRVEFDAADMDGPAINRKIRDLMSQGYGWIVVKNPLAKHSLGVGILQKLKLDFEGSLGYFGVGLIDGPNVRIKGRVGWSCAENMLAGTVVIEKNAGSCFGAAIRGGDLVCKGDVGARTGIDQKGGSIIIGGRTGAFSGFMMQRGRMVVCGDAGKNLGDSMYDGTIFVGGTIQSLGVDAVEAEMTDLDAAWLGRKLGMYGLEPRNGIRKMTKIVAGKQLWSYDNLEPTEKKLVL